jgi:hypothetical protein
MKSGDSEPPKLSDFSKDAVQKAVLREAATHPATLYTAVFGTLGALTWGLFGLDQSLLISFGAFLAASSSFVVNYFFRYKTLASRYIEDLVERSEEDKRSRVESIQGELKRHAHTEGAGPYVLQAVEQFKRARQKFDNLNELFQAKLGSGDLRIGRVLGAAEQVYVSALDNLEQVKCILDSVSTIDPNYIKARLKHLTGLKKPTEADRQEFQTLKARLKLRADQLNQINQLLTINEQAMTELEEATASVAVTRVNETEPILDAETSIRRMRELTRSAPMEKE